MNVYVILRSTGEYDDYCQYPVRVLNSEDDAAKYCLRKEFQRIKLFEEAKEKLAKMECFLSENEHNFSDKDYNKLYNLQIRVEKLITMGHRPVKVFQPSPIN